MIEIRKSPEVEEARANKRPVVALESTIITHGFPYPENLEMAQAVENKVRDSGAIPATIAVIDGVAHIGLTKTELQQLAQMPGIAKLSRADLAFAMAKGESGATTVAATMILAHVAGIKVFATGGIGGVHRGAENSFDISADLQELAQTPVTVVCAGPKSILDLPKTLEVLETLGVPVIGYRTKELPAFWSQKSGLQVPLFANAPSEFANSMKAREALGIRGGQLVVNPIPDAYEIPRSEMEPMIAAAIADAKANALTGKDVTPNLLQHIAKASGGRSIEANKALVLNNAKLAAHIALNL